MTLLYTAPDSARAYTRRYSAKYVPAPLGYGADSYRVWEALLLGAVPVVERRGFEDLFEGLPVLVVDNLFTDVSKYLLENEYHHVRCPKGAVSEEGAGGVRRHKWGKLTRSYWVRQMLAVDSIMTAHTAELGASCCSISNRNSCYSMAQSAIC